MPDTDTVFVVHGRDGEARDALFAFLRSLSLRPLEWLQAIKATGKPAPLIPEILDTALAKAQAIVVLLTGDDEVRLKPTLIRPDDPVVERDLTPQARPNVLFEAGLAFGRCPDRTVIVELGHVKPFSDNAGRHVVRLSNSTEARQELAMKLSAAGCSVDLSGTDWHRAGSFPNRSSATPADPTPDPTPVRSGRSLRDVARAGAPVAAAATSTRLNLSTSIEVAEPSQTSASDFSCRLTRAASPYWIFGWNIRVSNRSRGNATYVIECRFLDDEGHVMDTAHDISSVVIAPGETKELPGSGHVHESGASSVVRVVAVVSRRSAT